MARATVTVTCPECGEEWRWSVNCYNRREAEEWEAKHEGEERLCKACWKAEREEERNAARRENRAKAEELTAKAGKTLVRLTGSDKQVAWAEDIRARVLVEVMEANPSAKVDVLDILNLEPEARFWIDNDGVVGIGVLEKIWKGNKFDCMEIMRRAEAAEAVKKDVERPKRSEGENDE